MDKKEAWVKRFYEQNGRMPEPDEYQAAKDGGFVIAGDDDEKQKAVGAPIVPASAQQTASSDKQPDAPQAAGDATDGKASRADAAKASADGATDASKHATWRSQASGATPSRLQRGNHRPPLPRKWLIAGASAAAVVIVGVAVAVKHNQPTASAAPAATSSKVVNSAKTKKKAAKDSAAASSRAAAKAASESAASASAASASAAKASSEAAASALAQSVGQAISSIEGRFVGNLGEDNSENDVVYHSDFYKTNGRWQWKLTGNHAAVLEAGNITAVNQPDETTIELTIASTVHSGQTLTVTVSAFSESDYILKVPGVFELHQFLKNKVDVGNLTTQQAEDWAWMVFDTDGFSSRELDRSDYKMHSYIQSNGELRIDIYDADADEDEVDPIGSYVINSDQALVDVWSPDDPVIVSSVYSTEDQ